MQVDKDKLIKSIYKRKKTKKEIQKEQFESRLKIFVGAGVVIICMAALAIITK